MSYTPAPLLDEVRFGQRTHRLIVHAYEIGVKSLEPPANKNVRRLLLFDKTETVHGPLHRRHHDYVYPSRQQLLDPLGLELRVIVGR